jgi:hypothetical protein
MSISHKTQRLLLARSGGYCQNPQCNVDLYPSFQDGTITNIAELAHIIAQKEDGPRGKSTTPLSDRDDYDNIILLCSSCHTMIDKNPDKYSLSTLRTWKANHEERIKANFHIPTFENRTDLRLAIQRILDENKVIFIEYGPQSDFAKTTPQSEASEMWKIKAIETIIPNNRKVYDLLSTNDILLNEKEHKIVATFRLHKEGFEYNKLSGDKNSTVPLFPEEINEILK